MKIKYIIGILTLSICPLFVVAQEAEGTIKFEGAKGSFRTEKGTVLKVFLVEDEGAEFRAYLVSWNNMEIVISDAPTRRQKMYQVGDTVNFMVHRTDLQREEIKPILSFMLIPEFEMPKREKKD